MESQTLGWQNYGGLPSRKYICGYCGNDIAENHGFSAQIPGRTGFALIYLCHYCSSPTYFDPSGRQWPGATFGQNVLELPPNGIAELYDEARRSISATAYTASVLCSRKLLMNIAVSKGAKEGLKFVEYVDFLSDKGYTPPDGKEWVDIIRTKGNDATHEIALMKQEDAEVLLTFMGMLLKFVYEFPAIARKSKAPKA